MCGRLLVGKRFVERFCQAGSVCALFNFMNRLVEEAGSKAVLTTAGLPSVVLMVAVMPACDSQSESGAIASHWRAPAKSLVSHERYRPSQTIANNAALFRMLEHGYGCDGLGKVLPRFTAEGAEPHQDGELLLSVVPST